MSWGDRAAEQHEKDQPSTYDPLSLAPSPLFGGIRIVEDPHTRKGIGHMVGDIILLGTRPWTEIERAGWHARWIVNQGLSDVVEWIGESHLPRNPPEYDVTDFLRRGYEVEMPSRV